MYKWVREPDMRTDKTAEIENLLMLRNRMQVLACTDRSTVSGISIPSIPVVLTYGRPVTKWGGEGDLWIGFEMPYYGRDEPENVFEVRQMFVSVMAALSFVHDLGYFHGDIKLSNVCYSRRDGLAVLIDYAHMRLSPAELDSCCLGTPGYVVCVCVCYLSVCLASLLI